MKTILWMAICLFVDCAITTIGYCQPDTIWTRTLGSEGSEEVSSVVVLRDGNYLIIGSCSSDTALSTAKAVLLNPLGDVLWEREWSLDTVGLSAKGVLIESENSFLIWGEVLGRRTERSTYLCRMSNEGAIEWQTTYSSGNGHTTNGFLKTNRGYYFLIQIGGFGLIRLNLEFDTLWTCHYPRNPENDYTSIAPSGDEGCVVLGLEYPNSELMGIKVDSMGTVVLSRNLRLGFGDGVASKIIRASNGNYLFVGGFRRGYGQTIYPIYRYMNQTLSIINLNQWDAYAHSYGNDVIQTTDGNYLSCGNAFIDGGYHGYVERVDSTINLTWRRTLTESAGRFCALTESEEGDIIAVGSIVTERNESRDADFWIVKFERDSLGVQSDEAHNAKVVSILSPFPNPFNSSTTISYDVARPGFVRLGVYDAGGRLVGTVKEGFAGAGRYSALWNGGNVGSGTYFLNLEAGGETMVKPVVLVR